MLETAQQIVPMPDWWQPDSWEVAGYMAGVEEAARIAALGATEAYPWPAETGDWEADIEAMRSDPLRAARSAYIAARFRPLWEAAGPRVVRLQGPDTATRTRTGCMYLARDIVRDVAATIGL